MKIENNMKKIIEVYHNGYFITKFAFKKKKEQVELSITKCIH